jgi:hypothetical protein
MTATDTADMRACRIRMSRYDGLLMQAECLWQRERAAKVPIEGSA